MPRGDSQSNQSDKLIAEIKFHAEKIQKFYAALKTLSEVDRNVIVPDLSEFIKIDGQNIPNTVDKSIRGDEFHGKPIPLAVELYLRKIGHAVSFDDIYDALNKGGITFTSNGKTVLANAIRRDDDKFEKIKNGHIGLKEWYGSGRRTRSRDTKSDELDEINVDPQTGAVTRVVE